jgi:arylsulfatase A-like enzyme
LAAVRRSGFASALLAGAALAGCAARPTAPPPDIVLVSIDTLRADRLGVYGSTSGATPEIDRFREGAALFRTAVAQAPATLSSHASLFTSRLPHHHRANFAARSPLAEEETTLAEQLAAHGYRTRALVGGGQLRHEMGLGQGFASYQAMWEKARPGAFAAKVGRALAVLAEPDPRPLFLFLHTYEVHFPYRPERKILEQLDPGYTGPLGDHIEIATLQRINEGELAIDERDARRILACYDGELASVDTAFGRLARAVAERDGQRPTVLLLTSDHGEEFGEHGRQGWHGHSLFDELMLVPAILALPGGRYGGVEVTLPVRSIDLAPTLLELAGVPVPTTFAGRSLVPLLRGESLPELPAVFQRSLFGGETGPDDGIRWRGWKLHAGRLYDLRRDPGERDDRSSEAPELRSGLERLLAEAVARGKSSSRRTFELDDDAVRDLRALGYL